MEQEPPKILPYSKKGSQVFYGNLLVPSAVPSSFVDLGKGYGKDKFNAYFTGQRVLKANVRSFQVIEQNIPDQYHAKDSYNFYINGKPYTKKNLDQNKNVSTCSIL